MTISDRDRRALIILGSALAAGRSALLVLQFLFLAVPEPELAGSKISAPVDSVDRTEKRLAMLRRQAATLPGKQAV